MSYSAQRAILEARRRALTEPAREAAQVFSGARQQAGTRPAFQLDPGKPLGDQDADELRQIDAALARLREGSYGYCQICGEEIAGQLLDLVPSTRFCNTCAE
ncbi:TraR/DksA family transcriptional regulator [Pseudophaeobacter flagellatus]|uniref:TraR/DksA family transcriptional regulator n=1 Tax=Pseudophaeobacter flagellatus TaxID=2899119 RepID=UPI001E47D054|nr:TraR/DksA C4-type zinc finger protein [Pseudophaeobacter flagellatus]MCD9149479.1 TraR/DksA C4-type zinc finger protein [Pseudophaeobacter flagellatus]